jgi:hypothetical protein
MNDTKPFFGLSICPIMTFTMITTIQITDYDRLYRADLSNSANYHTMTADQANAVFLGASKLKGEPDGLDFDSQLVYVEPD